MLQETEAELANMRVTESKTQQEMERAKAAGESLARDIADSKR